MKKSEKMEWSGLTKDFSQFFRCGDENEIIKLVSQNCDSVISAARNNHAQNALSALNFGESQLKYFFMKEIQSNPQWRTIYNIGSLQGMVKLSKIVCSDRLHEECVLDESIFLTTKIRHLDDIVDFLYIHKQATHSDICEGLDLKNSTLSECMKKVLLTGLVNSRKSGLFKVYYLSQDGLVYARRISGERKQSVSQSLIEKNLTTFLEDVGVPEEDKKSLNSIFDRYLGPTVHNGDEVMLSLESGNESGKWNRSVVNIISCCYPEEEKYIMFKPKIDLEEDYRDNIIAM